MLRGNADRVPPQLFLTVRKFSIVLSLRIIEMLNTDRPIIRVTCAIIEQNGLVLAAQRSGSMTMPFKWEFPGGKIKAGESPNDCLKRELVEELGVKISVLHPLHPSTYEYPSITVTFYPFICAIADGEISLNEHEALIWLPPEKLSILDWAEADLPVLAAYRLIHGGPYQKVAKEFPRTYIQPAGT
jgi:8-oxo-dGTP diphosphatase